MKKLVLFIFSFFILTTNVYAKKVTVTLEKCVDGDTAWFKLNNETIKTRFLAIDTPESTKEIEEYGKEASKYTCEELSNARKIEIEYDDESDKTDKYDRHLVWVFVDEKLLQEKILRKGYANIDYIYGNYKYLDELYKVEETAKNNKVGIWGNYKEEKNNYLLLIIGILIIIVVCIFSKKERNKILKNIKKETKKELKKIMKN